MKVDRVGNYFIARLSESEAKSIYDEMAMKNMMGNLVGDPDGLEALGILIAVALERSKLAENKKRRKAE